MSHSARTKPLVYFELLERFRSVPGCAMCGVAGVTSRRYLESLSWELVNDPDSRRRLRDSMGFCPAHAREMEATSGPLAVAILFEDLLRVFEGELDAPAARPFWRRGRVPGCPACEAAREQEGLALRVLADWSADPELAGAFRSSSGLCRPHTLALLRLLPEAERRRVAAEEKERAGRLRAELAEVQRKHDHRFAREPWGAEKDAPARAVAKITGSRAADSPSKRRPGPGPSRAARRDPEE